MLGKIGILSFCLFMLFMGFSKEEYWNGLPFPFPVDHIVSDLSIMPACLGWPHRTWLSFIELDKAVGLVWLNWLVSCEYGFSVSSLWCSLATPTVLLEFLLPGMWGIPSQLLQQSTAWNSWAISNSERWCCESAALNTPANLENSSVAIGLEKVSFHSNPKERQCQRMLKLLHSCTHLTPSKVILKILQARL